MSSSTRQIEIQFEDPNPQKWRHPLKEDVFAALMSRENSYKTASLFSPLLFGKFFDPSDAFPLWEFESDALLPNSGQRIVVDWSQTDADYVLKAEIPGFFSSLQICVENGKILEISALWRQGRDCRTNHDWRNNHWWECGGVRRIELPENCDWRKAEAHLRNDVVLEIRIPKANLDCDAGKEM